MTDLNPRYVLGESEREIRRLMLQGRIYGEATRHFLEAAGIRRGMSVLDVGCGPGDVSLLLAGMVGSSGRVLGIDISEVMVGTARSRAEGRASVDFRIARVETFRSSELFDAVVGRWILAALPDPAEALGTLLACVRPGGVVAFAELDMTVPPWAFPDVPRSARPIVPLIMALANGPRKGAWLAETYVAAGLPLPELRLEVPIGGGLDWPGYEYLAETLRSLMPSLVNRGWDAGGIDLDTLADRLRCEIIADHGVLRLAGLLGAWTLRP